MKECKPYDDRGLDGIEKGLMSLFNAQLLLGKELVKLAGNAGAAAGMLRDIPLPKGSNCCDVPEPCWMPRSLGDIHCKLRPGDTGTVCLLVTNEDFRPHTYQFAATGKEAAAVSFSTAAATLGPKERVAVTVTFTVPRDDRVDDCSRIDHDVVIWVRSCRNYYLRWTIDEAECSGSCCEQIVVDDVPDYTLHWYDHFYMLRPCLDTPRGNATAEKP